MTEERIKQKKESEMLLSSKESDEINDSKSNTIKMRRTKEERRIAMKGSNNDKAKSTSVNEYEDDEIDFRAAEETVLRETLCESFKMK